jgi:CBS domain containing-hemolysin-like protein
VGVLNVKDLLPIIRRGEAVELARIMRPPFFVPETKKINRLLRQFQRKHIVMAIVSDEFGGVSGIVTIEDIMEELVGEIQDEYDNEVPVVEKVSEDEYRVNPATPISDANEYLPFPLPEGEDYETVGGLLNVIYGSIPEVGDVAVLDPYEFRVAGSRLAGTWCSCAVPPRLREAPREMGERVEVKLKNPKGPLELLTGLFPLLTNWQAWVW